MKKILSCILILVTILALAQPAFAAQLPGNDPQYTNAQRVYVQMCINSSGKAIVSLYVKGKVGLKDIDVSIRIEKKSGSTWTTTERWSCAADGMNLSEDNEVQLDSTGQYRVVANFTLTAATVEYITDIDYATY